MAFNFKNKIKEIQNLKQHLPAQIGNIAKRHFVDSFRNQGFTDTTLDPWQVRKTKDKSDRNRRNADKPRAILVKTGHLRNSIRVRVATFNLIEIGAYGVPYASFHNKGEGKLPKRQFIGRSRSLDMKIQRKINQEIKKII